jgi:Uma2 family endonuclease
MSSQTVPFMTPEEYLAKEREAEFKSEYYQGQVYAMAGARESHVLIVLNIGAELRHALKGRPCQIYPSEMRLHVPATGLYTYPDITVVCGERVFIDSHRDTITNPHLIMEVLSKSTEAYDRGLKFSNYQSIPSLREYVLVSQDLSRVEQFGRQSDQGWRYQATEGPGMRVKLTSIEVELALDEIYSNVEFAIA